MIIIIINFVIGMLAKGYNSVLHTIFGAFHVISVVLQLCLIVVIVVAISKQSENKDDDYSNLMQKAYKLFTYDEIIKLLIWLILSLIILMALLG
jgi:hypothetical protein